MSFQAPPFPVPQAPPKTTIKLALEAPNAEKEGPFVRVPLSGAITSETMDHLKERALDLWKLHNAPGKHQIPKAKVTFTYRDIENDLCYIFSDDDLRCALPLFPASLRVFARVEVPLKKAAAEKAAAAVVQEETKDKAEETPAPESTAAEAASNNNKTTQTSSNRSVSDVPAQKVVESLVGVLTTAAVALQNNVKSPAKEDETKSKDDERLFIHGRHTCDGCLTTPIVGTRWHASNLPDYDLCGACKDNYKGNEVTFEAAELDRDRPMQERWNRRFSKFQAKQDKKQGKWAKKQEKRASKQAAVVAAPEPAKPKPSPVGPPPPFHHPPFCGPPPHHGPPHYGPPFGPRRGRWGHRYYAAQPEQVDRALQEAIRRSQAELEAAQNKLHKANQVIVAETKNAVQAVADATEERKKEEPKAEVKKEEEEEFEIPPVAPVGAHPAPRSAEEEETKPSAVVPAVIEKEESKPVSEESFSDDAQGNGDVAVSLGETMDMIASAVDEMKDLLARGSDADSNKNEEEVIVDAPTANTTEEETEKVGATIVQGEEEEEEEVKSTDGSENSWNVVGGDQLAADEALARAAHVIGSALFESGTAESNNPSMLGSDHSVPTTLPSVASQNGAAQEAQAQRWALHLSQLHELGFMNDALSVEIMERLEAADIGSGETQEVTVERVVNELMKDW